ncbi:MAG TPA: hypothetical protein VIY28_11625 [Pseudonocardiaceae bacterium]
MLQDERRLAGDNRFNGVQGAVLAAPTGGWTFRLDAVKEFSGDPPDDNALLTGLSDDRSQAQPSTIPYRDSLTQLATLEKALRSPCSHCRQTTCATRSTWYGSRQRTASQKPTGS